MTAFFTAAMFCVSLLAMYLIAATIAYGLIVTIIHLHNHLQARKPRPMATRKSTPVR